MHLALLSALRSPSAHRVLSDPQWESLALLHGPTLATREVNARPAVASGSSEPTHETRTHDRRAHTLARSET